MNSQSLPHGVNMLGKLVILTDPNRTVTCSAKNCFNFVFLKCSDEKIRCNHCMTVHELAEGEREGLFPRPRREYWDRFNQLPNYSFLKDNAGNVRKVPMRSGDYKEGYETGRLVEEMQDEINSLRDRLARLEPKAV